MRLRAGCSVVMLLQPYVTDSFSLQKTFAYGDVGLKKALAQKWIEYDKSGGGNALRVTPKGMEAAVDDLCLTLRRLEAGDSAEPLPEDKKKDFEKVVTDCKKRGLVDKR